MLIIWAISTFSFSKFSNMQITIGIIGFYNATIRQEGSVVSPTWVAEYWHLMTEFASVQIICCSALYLKVYWMVMITE